MNHNTPRYRIAAFGEVMMRLQVPGYESLSQSQQLHYSFSGTGVNIASALSRFGHTGYLISTLPDHSLGEAALAYLRKLNINTSYIVRDGKYLGMYFLENGFGARAGKVTYTDRQGSSFNTSDPALYNWNHIASNIDMAHFCGITLAMNDNVRTQMKTFAQEVQYAGGKVVFDCNYRPSLWAPFSYQQAKPHYEHMLKIANIVMMNEKDAIYTLGMTTTATERIEQLKDLIPQVAAQYDIEVVAGTHRYIHNDNTHSLQGYLYKDGVFTFSATLRFAVYDRIGAGDAYTSGIIHGELCGLSPQQTVNYAATAAMLAHTVVGDTPTATEAEVWQAMTDPRLDVER